MICYYYIETPSFVRILMSPAWRLKSRVIFKNKHGRRDQAMMRRTGLRLSGFVANGSATSLTWWCTKGRTLVTGRLSEAFARSALLQVATWTSICGGTLKWSLTNARSQTAIYDFTEYSAHQPRSEGSSDRPGAQKADVPACLALRFEWGGQAIISNVRPELGEIDELSQF